MMEPKFEIRNINDMSNAHWEILILLEDGQQFIGNFSSVENLINGNIFNLNSSVVLVESLNTESIIKKIEDYLINDGFYTSFFPVNKKATNTLFNLVS